MSLQKGKPVKFARPIGSMKTVYECVEEYGPISRVNIIKQTGLVVNKGRAAIWNLVYVGAIEKTEDANGLTVYCLPQLRVSSTLKSVRSIFDTTNPLPTSDNRTISPD